MGKEGVDAERAALMLRRASELAVDHRGEDGVPSAVLELAAVEVGMSRIAVRQAAAEVDAGYAGRGGRIFGPSRLFVHERIEATESQLVAGIDDKLRGDGFRLEGHGEGTSRWVATPGAGRHLGCEAIGTLIVVTDEEDTATEVIAVVDVARARRMSYRYFQPAAATAFAAAVTSFAGVEPAVPFACVSSVLAGGARLAHSQTSPTRRERMREGCTSFDQLGVAVTQHRRTRSMGPNDGTARHSSPLATDDLNVPTSLPVGREE